MRGLCSAQSVNHHLLLLVLPAAATNRLVEDSGCRPLYWKSRLLGPKRHRLQQAWRIARMVLSDTKPWITPHHTPVFSPAQKSSWDSGNSRWDSQVWQWCVRLLTQKCIQYPAVLLVIQPHLDSLLLLLPIIQAAVGNATEQGARVSI